MSTHTHTHTHTHTQKCTNLARSLILELVWCIYIHTQTQTQTQTHRHTQTQRHTYTEVHIPVLKLASWACLQGKGQAGPMLAHRRHPPLIQKNWIMYVSMYLCMHVCMYACLYPWFWSIACVHRRVYMEGYVCIYACCNMRGKTRTQCRRNVTYLTSVHGIMHLKKGQSGQKCQVFHRCAWNKALRAYFLLFSQNKRRNTIYASSVWQVCIE